MGWDYADKLNNLTLADVATHVRAESHGGAGFLDTGYQIPGRDGLVFDPEAPFAPLNILMRVILRYSNKSDVVTHTDGAAGHVFENLYKIQRELARPECIWTRTFPHAGTLRAPVRLFGEPAPEQARHIYLFPLVIPTGSWQDNVESSESGDPPTVTTSGTRRIPDPVLIFSAAGTFGYTTSTGIEYEVEAESGPTYPVAIDVGAGTIKDDNGDDASEHVAFSRPRDWLQLEPDATLSLSADVSVTLKWRNRWA